MTTDSVSTQIPRSRVFECCPLGCKTDLQKSAITLAEGLLLRCPTCTQLLSSCTREQYELALNKWDTPCGTQPDSRSVSRFRHVARRRLGQALKLLGPRQSPPRLLDVGCSSGSLLAVAAELGFSVVGVEIASKAAQTAQEAGFEVFPGSLHEAHFPDKAFDVITLIELIEHVRDPLVLLSECHRILKQGGIIVINTPNADSWTARFMRERWEGFSLTAMGGHISFFSPSSIRVLARALGLVVAHMETRNVRFYEKGQCHPIIYRLAKIMQEFLALPARIAGRGHDLLIYLQPVK
jgi:2-polyprenyl-3-methyl-5-hydroxy-6-metoxy-1,4-benzoquinol methylase